MAQPAAQDGIRLCVRLGWAGAYIPVLLTISLTLNILALCTDFLEFSMFLKGTFEYNLPHMVWMMWNEKLYVIALLILFFSIIFPLFKLLAMYIVWFWPRTLRRQKRIYAIVKNLGKWSFMDIFIVSILLALTNEQAAVQAVPKIGVYFFIAAILISMITSEILHGILRRTELKIGVPTEPAVLNQLTCPLFTLRRFGWFIGVLLIGSLVSLFSAIGFPFLEINQMFLDNRDYNIFEVVEAVFGQHQPVVGTMLALFLIVTPAVHVLGTTALWFAACRLGRRLWCTRWMRLVSRWSMLDVFGLSLILILTEGQRMIKTDVKAGAYLLVLAIALTVVLPWLALKFNPAKRLREAGTPVRD